MKKFLNQIARLIQRKNFIMSSGVFLTFTVLAAILLNLPVRDIGRRMIAHIDAYLVSWIWSWEGYILNTQPWRLFEANIFAPFHHTLAFSETMLGSFLLAWPIMLVSGNNAALTYNLVMLLTYAIAGLGMYQLVFYLTKNRLAAFVSATIYALAPFKLLHNGHLHLSGMWLPYFFLYLEKFFKNFGWLEAFKLSGLTVLIFLTSLHYIIFLPLAVLLAWLIRRKDIQLNKERLVKFAIIILTAALFALPFIIPYQQVRQEYGQFRSTQANKKYAPTLVDYFTPPLYYELHGQRSNIEMVVTPGCISWLIFLAALVWLFLKRKTIETNKKKTIIFYLSLGGLAFLISFGFYWRLTPAAQVYWPGLFALLYSYWPGFSGIRATGRYSVFLLLSIAVISGLVLNYWQNKYKFIKRHKLSLTVILVFLLLANFSLVPVLNYSRPYLDKNEQKLIAWMKQQNKDKIFLELPMGVNKNGINNDIYYVFASRWHFKKIVNGYSGYYPPGYLELVQSSRFFKSRQIMPWLKKFKVNYIIFHWARYTDEQKKILMQNIRQNDKIKYITNFGDNYIYQVTYN